MSRHYLLYWSFKIVEYHFYGEPLDQIAGNHLNRIEPLDVIWIVTQRTGDLLLVGRLIVGEVVDNGESDEVFDEYSLWNNARWHLTSASSTAEPMQLINLSALAVPLTLRFQSTSDRLRTNKHGRLNMISLYQPRLLTDESVGMLNYVWYNGQAVEHLEIEAEPLLYTEGKPIKQTRVIRQRSSGLVAEVKNRYLNDHGDLRCEICGISFSEVYGVIGDGYIEAHHPNPVSAMDREQFTDVDDIVLICANCHRVIHRKTPPYSIDDLRRAIQKQRDQKK